MPEIGRAEARPSVPEAWTALPLDIRCFLSSVTGTNSIPHLGHLPGWSCTTPGCITQVYWVTSGLGVCARSAEPIVTIKIRVKKFLSIIKGAEYLRRFCTDGGFRLVHPCAYLA